MSKINKIFILLLSLLFLMVPVEARQKVIVIQPGHTVGIDSGACGKTIQEASLNEDVACRLTNELERRGYKVYLTHCSRPEYAPKTLVSVEEANSLRNLGPAVNSVHPDLAFSIHHNSGGSRSSGYEIYWSSFRDFDQDGVYKVPGLWSDGAEAFRDLSPCYVASESKRLADIVHSCMNGKNRIGYNGTFERDDYLPAHSKAPCILFEGGYLSNPSEEAYMGTEEYKNDMTLRLADSADQYFRTAPLPTGLVVKSEVTNMAVGESAKLNVSPLPKFYPNEDYTVAPVDTNIIQVSEDGTITAQNPGSIVVQVRPADNPDVYSLARITVYERTNYSVKYVTASRSHGLSGGQNGLFAGTLGNADPVYQITAAVVDGNGNQVDPGVLGIQYRAHVSNIGWQNYVANGQPAGTDDTNSQIEGLQMQLTGSEAANYDIYYRSHCSNFGWCSFAENNGLSGSEGHSLGIEGIEVLILPKSAGMVPDTSGVQFYTAYGAGQIRYNTHVSELGWTNFTADGNPSGAEGQNLGLEAVQIIPVAYLPEGNIVADAHIAYVGWQHFEGSFMGTTGQARHIEAIRLSLNGELGNQYDIHYQVFVRGQGWTDEAVNGQTAGTEGQSLPLDSIKIWLTHK